MEPENEHMKDEESMDVAKRKKLGGIKTLPFILGMYTQTRLIFHDLLKLLAIEYTYVW